MQINRIGSNPKLAPKKEEKPTEEVPEFEDRQGKVLNYLTNFFRRRRDVQEANVKWREVLEIREVLLSKINGELIRQFKPVKGLVFNSEDDYYKWVDEGNPNKVFETGKEYVVIRTFIKK